MSIYYVKTHFYPDEKTIEVKAGTTILRAAQSAGVRLAHKCGGKGACLTCKVKIEDQSTISPPTNSERQKLGLTALEEGYRLACQSKVLSNSRIEVPEDPLKAAIRKQLAKQKENKNSIWDD